MTTYVLLQLLPLSRVWEVLDRRADRGGHPLELAIEQRRTGLASVRTRLPMVLLATKDLGEDRGHVDDVIDARLSYRGRS